MKYMATRKHSYRYTALAYGSRVGTGGTVEYLPNPTLITFAGGKAAGGNLLIYTDTALIQYMKLDSLKDSSGELIYPQTANAEIGQSYIVSQVQPVLSVSGTREGFRVYLKAIT